MDSELSFEWPSESLPELPDARTDAMCPPEWLHRQGPEGGAPPDAGNLRRQLDEAQATIAQLKAAGRAAGIRIDELEAARDASEARVTAQRRRLLVLERQLEGLGASPAGDATPAPVSWLQRLLGGPPPEHTRTR